MLFEPVHLDASFVPASHPGTCYAMTTLQQRESLLELGLGYGVTSRPQLWEDNGNGVLMGIHLGAVRQRCGAGCGRSRALVIVGCS